MLNMTIEIIRADQKTFKAHKKEILEIVVKHTSLGTVMAQLLDEEDEWNYMLSVFDANGYSYIALEKGKAIGYLLVGPLSHDPRLPDSIKRKYPVENCFYIEEMHMLEPGTGLGSRVMAKFLSELDRKKWQYLFVRSWWEPCNTGAIKFYKKFGFKDSEIIEQEKIRIEDHSKFMIKKRYFVQKL